MSPQTELTEAIRAVEALKDRAKERLDEATAHLRELDEEYAAMAKTVEILERDDPDGGGVRDPQTGRRRRLLSKHRMNLSGKTLDFGEDRNMTQRLVRIVRATEDGVVTPVHARNILLDAGVSGAGRSNLRNVLQKRMSESPDFRKVGVGRYRYEPGGQWAC